MRMRGRDAGLVEQVRGMAERQVGHMTRLIDDLLDVSRISQGKIQLRKEPVDLATVVTRAVEATRPLIDEKGHHLAVALPGLPVSLEGDSTRLEQVISNLLNNAAKYTEPGGRIWLTAAREGTGVALRVKDTGIGLAPDMIPKIFDLFVQADRSLDRAQGGLGIGLTLVNRLVEMHGGRVEAHSPGPGKGSEFVVYLPASHQEPGASLPAGQPRSEKNDHARRVLVVDDNVDAADSLAMMVRLWGHNVLVAHSGQAALEMAQSQPPDVVLLDIGLPGMNGFEVARRLRSDLHLDQAMLVALTGYGQDEDRRRSFEAGLNYHLTKPVEPEALQALLARGNH
jgi:two-component system CheB/CheR fusion protein